MKIHNSFLTLLSFVLLFAPAYAFAHATPVSYVPDASSVILKVAHEVTIHFSENIDASASGITVLGPAGTSLSQGDAHVVGEDRRIFSVPIVDGGDGAYRVSWSVVSADDGHFTKGSYVFVVGSGTPIKAGDTSSVELVENTTVPESVAMTVELMGNGLIWATLVLWHFIIRPLRKKTGASERRTLDIWYGGLLLFAVLLAVVGGVAQVAIKTESLAMLRNDSFFHTLPLYLATIAGQANLWRLGAAFAVGVLAVFFSKKITSAEKSIYPEWMLIFCMCIFAFFRAKISHATANPFYPDFSVAVNFLHLIEKDIWAGLLGILCLFSLSKRMRGFFGELLPRTFTLLAINVGAVSVTACYIVWLHLKSWDNLFSTEWGNAFLKLLCVAVFIIGARLYHTLALRYKPSMYIRYSALSLAAEFALSVLVVYFSSVSILTSPPLVFTQDPVFVSTNQGVSIRLARDTYEDGMLLLTTSGSNALHIPTVTSTEMGSNEPTSVELTERYPGGYVFPIALLATAKDTQLVITVPQDSSYDAHAQFLILAGAFTKASPFGSRPFDGFAYVFISIALLGALFSYILVRLLKGIPPAPMGAPLYPKGFAIFGFVVTLCCIAGGVSAFGASSFANPFKVQCEGDGNMWHLMLPTKAGVPVAQTPQEGCMWGMGQYMYMFPDRREYTHLASLPKADVSLEHADTIQAGVPTTFTVKLQEPDGSPAKLFVDMEKLLHVVIVSQDEKVFAHIHADDVHPLTPEEMRTSTFTLTHTFPKAGTYLISADYAHGLSLESKQFTVEVKGVSRQEEEPATYPLSGTFGGYGVSLSYGGVALAGEVTTLRYTISKNGQPVTTLEQYLSAAMHVSVVKNDLGTFIHTHGEVHPPGVPYPPIIIKNGQVVHSMAMMLLPPTFGPNVEAHLIFPSAGEYTVWGEFKAEGKVIPTSFTIRVD